MRRLEKGDETNVDLFVVLSLGIIITLQLKNRTKMSSFEWSKIKMASKTISLDHLKYNFLLFACKK